MSDKKDKIDEGFPGNPKKFITDLLDKGLQKGATEVAKGLPNGIGFLLVVYPEGLQDVLFSVATSMTSRDTSAELAEAVARHLRNKSKEGTMHTVTRDNPNDN